jgi:hypothetical protein
MSTEVMEVITAARHLTPAEQREVLAQLWLEANEELFQALAAQWRKETRHQSSVSQMAMHPAYQRIIGMGEAVVPHILKEMRQRGGHWLWALHAITGEAPASADANFHKTVQSWLQWGREKGYLSSEG